MQWIRSNVIDPDIANYAIGCHFFIHMGYLYEHFVSEVAILMIMTTWYLAYTKGVQVTSLGLGPFIVLHLHCHGVFA